MFFTINNSNLTAPEAAQFAANCAAGWSNGDINLSLRFDDTFKVSSESYVTVRVCYGDELHFEGKIHGPYWRELLAASSTLDW